MTSRYLTLAVLMSAVAAYPVRAEETAGAPTRKWKNAAELSVVSANGNSKANTNSAKNTFTYNWSDVTGLELLAGALGTKSNGTVTAEQYNASEKVTWKLVGSNYVYEKFGWESNRFAGVRHRYDGNVGLGRLLMDLPKHKWSAELGGGYVAEELINAPHNDYASGRAYSKYAWKLSETAEFSQDGEYLHSFDDSKAYRLKTETALIASMTTHLSLKTSFVWKRNAVPPAGTIKDDTLTSVALIINF